MPKQEGLPLLRHKHYGAPSRFRPESLLREARRQKGKGAGVLPAVCVLDPDGDTTRLLIERGRARKNRHWACYHTDLYEFPLGQQRCGILPCAVGAPFAVLVAEELFASGCRLLISVTSAGQIDPQIQPPCFLLVEKALRDEGTSFHYRAPSEYACLNPGVLARLQPVLDQREVPVRRGITWTTDAPFRETRQAIAEARRRGIQAVEMEAAALYAFAAARKKSVVCYALVTNQMGAIEGDFEKGDNHGLEGMLTLIEATCRALGRDVR